MKRGLEALVILVLGILIISCSQDQEDIEINETIEVDIKHQEAAKEKLYNKALQEIASENSTKKTGLDKRYDYLHDQIDGIIEGKEELNMAQFTRIKIELDYLMVSEYNPNKMNILTNNFKKAFAEARKKADEDDSLSGSSLNDRYYAINSKVEKISTGETELKVADYLALEDSLKKLEEDEYIESRITGLRQKLLKSVIAQLKSAIVEYQPPEIEEEIPVEIAPEIIEKSKEAVEEEEEITGPRTHIVKLIDGGLEVQALLIKVNDTIEWKNERTRKYKIGFIVGNAKCRDVRSEFYNPGESYSATFTEPGTCWISDGIYTTQAMRVIVG